MKQSNCIGFWGYPNPELVKEIKTQYPNSPWVDLDVDLGNPDRDILPKSYCKIIKNIVNNAPRYPQKTFLAANFKCKIDILLLFSANYVCSVIF